MKKLIMIVLTVLAVITLAACGATSNVSTKQEENGVAGVLKEDGESEKINIVTTIFPEYDWVKQILGDKAQNADITLLLDNGVDLHSYQPTAEDILKISNCDLFIYVGGESDKWVEDALSSAQNKDMEVINLMEVLGDSIKEEEMVEGMQESEHNHDHEHEEDADEHEHEEDADEHEHEHEEDADEHEHEHGEIEYDEHVWLSLKNAQTLVAAISQSIIKLDDTNADIYEANTREYNEKIAALDKEYEAVAEGADNKTILFGDRFPFRYMVDDYDIDYYAAFVGCSAETEASFETVSFLSGKVDELKLPVVLTIEGPDKKIAETIIQNTESKDAVILTMDSLQSTTLKDAESGSTYLSAMENNLEVLKEALK
ncbi:MAG: metal ABC transporter substrate-binding protein [Lachnospiraceae bacterium]|nr:metal ABC transporter substrate-binding protein [Lachnospiraceae bacterium]